MGVARLLQVARRARVNETVVIRYRRKDGSWRWFESAFSSQLDNPAVEG